MVLEIHLKTILNELQEGMRSSLVALVSSMTNAESVSPHLHGHKSVRHNRPHPSLPVTTVSGTKVTFPKNILQKRYAIHVVFAFQHR